ncbi:MAG TPA: sensor histidine kinase, partial [Dehalococcoidia bacterium]|nr:sensor histidine kinase [Dehalococcoidia bacterium]
IGLSLEVSGAPPAIPLDGARIERALTNLVQNALEHTPAGGDVKLRVESVSDGVAASVTDTGEGIGPGHLPRIWERFYRADPSRARADKAGGAGLGLAIVRGVVEAHGGNVDVQSEVGSGSCFTLRLPVAYHEASRR